MKTTILVILVLGLTGGMVFWLTRSSTPATVPPVEAPAQNATAEPKVSAARPAPNQAAFPVATLTEGVLAAGQAPAASVPTAPKPSPSMPQVPVPSVRVVEAQGGIPPAALVENMRTTVRQYGLMFGGNPVGTNEEITRALDGDNPKHVKFLGADGNRVNGRGELVDAWGTPYFFHQLSVMQMEVRSAGPDQTMWTADDLVVK